MNCKIKLTFEDSLDVRIQWNLKNKEKYSISNIQILSCIQEISEGEVKTFFFQISISYLH